MWEGEGEKSAGMHNMYANIMIRNVEFLIPCTRLLLPSHLTPPAVLERVGGVPLESQHDPQSAEGAVGGKSHFHPIPSAVRGIGDVPQPQQNALSAKRGVGGYLPSHRIPLAVEGIGDIPKSQRRPILAEMGIGGESPARLIPSALWGIGDVPQPQHNALSAKRGVGGYLPSHPTRKGGGWKDMCVCTIMMHRIMKIYRKEFFMMYLGRM